MTENKSTNTIIAIKCAYINIFQFHVINSISSLIILSTFNDIKYEHHIPQIVAIKELIPTSSVLKSAIFFEFNPNESNIALYF